MSNIIKEMPCWYISALILFSLYYSIRGVMEQYNKYKPKDTDKEEDKAKKDLTQFYKIFVHYIQEFLFKFIVTISSFISLLVVNHIFSSLESINDISAGTAIFLIFLIIWGICGISGYLTFLIVRGKFPGSK
jgi:hypothetical protein